MSSTMTNKVYRHCKYLLALEFRNRAHSVLAVTHHLRKQQGKCTDIHLKKMQIKFVFSSHCLLIFLQKLGCVSFQSVEKQPYVSSSSTFNLVLIKPKFLNWNSDHVHTLFVEVAFLRLHGEKNPREKKSKCAENLHACVLFLHIKHLCGALCILHTATVGVQICF